MNNKDQETVEYDIRQKYGADVEVRTMQLRASEEGGESEMILEGYAANFDQTTDLGYFNERIARGAFDDVLEDDVRYLVNHEGMPLARTANGTLELRVDKKGLYTRAKLSDTQLGRDTYKAVKRGDISEMSFAFTIGEQDVDTEKNLRTVTQVKRLYDVSAVTYPAYPTTTLEARSKFAASAEADISSPDDVENIADNKGAEAVIERQEKEEKNIRNFTETKKEKKIMNLNDLKGQRAAYYEEFVEIGKMVDAEGRGMTEAEQERADKLDMMVKEIDQKIEHKKREQDMIKRMAHTGVSSTSESDDIKATNYRFSLSRAINSVANQQNLEGAEAEWRTEAHREMRSQGLQPNGKVAIPSFALRASADNFTAAGAAAGGTAADGTGFVPTDVPAAIEALRAPSVIETLGAQVINAQGNLKFPRISSEGLATQVGEVTSNTGAGLELDEINMSPNRLSTTTTYSQQLILQGGPEVDRLIANDLRQELTEIIDRKAFAKILADGNVNDQSTDNTDTTFATAIAMNMEAAVLAAGGNLAGCQYVMSPTAYKLSKTLAQVANVNALFDGGRFNGYTPVATKHLADATTDTGQMIFGNFAQGLILAYFSGVDILVDPFSSASTGQIDLHLNRYYDVAIRQPGALSICTDLVA